MTTIKEQIITLLSANKDWVSGEVLSQQLGISRAAISKHINSMKNSGYLIEAMTRRGYFLKQIPDAIDVDTIKNQLQTKVIGQSEWWFLAEVPSTNLVAIDHAVKGATEGSIVITSKQTLGRGTKGKNWYSPPRSIYFSVILRPLLTLDNVLLIIDMGMLALQDTIQQLFKVTSILHAPNDLYINNKKIAGVSIEASIISHEIDWVVLGIGCNLNVELSEFPAQLQPYVASTFIETKQIIDRNLFYRLLFQKIDDYYQILQNDLEQFKKRGQQRING